MVSLTSCNQRIVGTEQVEADTTENFPWKNVDASADISFNVPLEWKKLDYSDTMIDYTSFRIYKNNDSAFFQLSLLDTFELDYSLYIVDLYNNIQEYTNADVDSLYIEEIVLSDKASRVYYASFNLRVPDHLQRTQLMIVPHKTGLIDIRLVIPQEWNIKYNKYLLSKIAFSLKNNEYNILNKSSRIQEVNALYYSQ